MKLEFTAEIVRLLKFYGYTYAEGRAEGGVGVTPQIMMRGPRMPGPITLRVAIIDVLEASVGDILILERRNERE